LVFLPTQVEVPRHTRVLLDWFRRNPDCDYPRRDIFRDNGTSPYYTPRTNANLVDNDRTDTEICSHTQYDIPRDAHSRHQTCKGSYLDIMPNNAIGIDYRMTTDAHVRRKGRVNTRDGSWPKLHPPGPPHRRMDQSCKRNAVRSELLNNVVPNKWVTYRTNNMHTALRALQPIIRLT